MKAVVGFAMIGFYLSLFATWLYGAILAFSASVVLGIISLFIEPSFLIYGLVKFFTNVDLAQKIVTFFSS